MRKFIIAFFFVTFLFATSILVWLIPHREGWQPGSLYKQLLTEIPLHDSYFAISTLKTIALIAMAIALVLAIILLTLQNVAEERKRQREELDVALESLKRSERFLRQLYDNSPSMIITHELEGNIITANEMVEKVLGKNDSRQHLMDVILPTYKKEFATFVENLKSAGASSGWFRLQDQHGQLKIFRYQSKVLESSHEQPVAITFALDDSEIFKARLEAELERQRLLSVMQNSPDVYAIFGRDSRIEFMNHPTFFDGKDATGNKVLDYVPQEVGAHFLSNLEWVYAHHQPMEFEERYRDDLYAIKLIPVLSHGVVKEVLGIGTNITEKRQREDREKELNLLIERNEKRYRKLVEASQVLICSHDLEGTILTVNAPGASSMGYHPQELMGHRLNEFIPEEFLSELQQYMHIVKTKGLYEGFLSVKRKDGSKRIFLCRNILLAEENIVLGSAQDVTEWKKAEFRERLIRKELQSAKEEAEESNRLKTIFLGSLSHEVRTPLQGILGFAEILESTAIPEPKRREYLGIIKRRTHDMQNIIESLLDLASVETGELRAVPVEMNLYEYAELMFSRTRQDYPALKDVVLLFESHLSPHSMAYIDAQHLNQVLINLIRNAVKFTNEGFIKIKFERLPSEYHISVTDTGIGIAEDKLSQIFMPFRQAHEGISRSKGGIGLGLAISKKMVALWKGEIYVESELGKGSTFTITIPID